MVPPGCKPKMNTLGSKDVLLQQLIQQDCSRGRKGGQRLLLGKQTSYCNHALKKAMESAAQDTPGHHVLLLLLLLQGGGVGHLVC